MHRSTQIKERFIQCIESGEITMSDELEIIEYMVKRLNPITQSEYAKRENISEPAAKKRLETGKESIIQIGKLKLVV